MNELYDEWMDSVMNELLWDVWVDICNCVCTVLYCILICIFVFQGPIKPLDEIKPHENIRKCLSSIRTRNTYYEWRFKDCDHSLMNFRSDQSKLFPSLFMNGQTSLYLVVVLKFLSSYISRALIGENCRHEMHTCLSQEQKVHFVKSEVLYSYT